jgi:hypothetical protein
VHYGASVTDPARDALSIELLKEWHHDPARSSEFLTQLTNRRRSIL